MEQSSSSLEPIDDPQPGTSKSFNKKTELRARRTGEQPLSKPSLAGELYELYWIMLLSIRGLSSGHDFQIASQVKQANKFDDIVVQYDTGKGKEYRLFQLKHSSIESKKINTQSLLTEMDGLYSLTKYFFSYTDSKRDPFFRNRLTMDVKLYTTITFDFDDLEREQIGLEEIEDNDILLVKSNEEQTQPKSYKFKENIIPLLLPKIQNYDLTRLAMSLTDCLLENKVMRHHQGIFKTYHLALVKEIFLIDSNRTRKIHLFQDAFIKNDPSLSEKAKIFRGLFGSELSGKSKGSLSLENINEAIENKHKVKETTHVGLNLSNGFGKEDKKIEDKNQIWIYNAIPQGDVEDFLNHLVFGVDLPNEEKLKNILMDELGKLPDTRSFDRKAKQEVFYRFYESFLNWFKGPREKIFLSKEEIKKFLENALNPIPILFGFSTPIDSFTGRSKELNDLHEGLQTRHIASISGLGGIGKSELARMYAYEHSKDYDSKVAWINAESKQTLTKSFIDLAEKLGISDAKAKSITTIVEDVYRFFSSGKSLFIFDNAEHLRSENDADAGISEFLPSLPKDMNEPFILITSRNRDWGETTKTIYLRVFTETEAIELVKKALTLEDDSQEIKELVKLLGYFPLALQQALAYIRRDISLQLFGEKSRTSHIKDYLEFFKKETKRLLEFKFPSNSDDLYMRTTYTTWSITIEKIKHDPEWGPLAVDILNMMAYLSPDDIDPRLFLSLVNNKECELLHPIGLLRQYSMIDFDQNKKSLSIHRLVQQVIIINLKNQEDLILEKVFELMKTNVLCKLEMESHLLSVVEHVDHWIPIDNRRKGAYIIQLITWLNEHFFKKNEKTNFRIFLKHYLLQYIGSYYFELAVTLDCLNRIYLCLGKYEYKTKLLNQIKYGKDFSPVAKILVKLGSLHEPLAYIDSFYMLCLNGGVYFCNKPFEFGEVLSILGAAFLALEEDEEEKKKLENDLMLFEKLYKKDSLLMNVVITRLCRGYEFLTDYCMHCNNVISDKFKAQVLKNIPKLSFSITEADMRKFRPPLVKIQHFYPAYYTPRASCCKVCSKDKLKVKGNYIKPERCVPFG